ncbi:hypothetical protein, partial [Paludibacterium sp.]|uniref:hypothetical protein n=1 Tax=Paludibacterium sp. TaxID=1917523 RepID=UPI0025DB36E8
MADTRRRALLIARLMVSFVMSVGAFLTQTARAETQRILYAVNQAPKDRGSISLYDIDAGHHLIRVIRTVSGVHDV